MLRAHTPGDSEPATIVAILGGAAVNLTGNVLFKWSISRQPAYSHEVGLAVLGLATGMSRP